MIDTSEKMDARRFRWLIDGNGYYLEEEMLCGHGSELTSLEEMNDARIKIDKQMEIDNMNKLENALKEVFNVVNVNEKTETVEDKAGNLFVNLDKDSSFNKHLGPVELSEKDMEAMDQSKFHFLNNIAKTDECEYSLKNVDDKYYLVVYFNERITT